ncbi:GNAT family N-acetyltransferase [Salinimonas sp. HHU 13199]|uniref:GNAT family N-acetyltransferase n=1 Tax=Salinimonas profundi TaxID=2729140 RepID=A0ABR8LE06_9ALTE|nr:GNAT family N-acetyltransferase [Salinimonas profundi]MBD3584522.1 GNAT family N-acetyltransferase [Salinimonas profundi]
MNVSFLAEQSHHSKTIAQWYYDEWAKNYNVPFNAVFEDVKSKSKSKNDVPLCFVATENNEAVGAVELKLYENKQYDYKHWLGGLFVIPGYRRLGIGKKLIQLALDHSQKLGIEDLYLQCKNEHSYLYSSFGFTGIHLLSDSTCVMVRGV